MTEPIDPGTESAPIAVHALTQWIGIREALRRTAAALSRDLVNAWRWIEEARIAGRLTFYAATNPSQGLSNDNLLRPLQAIEAPPEGYSCPNLLYGDDSIDANIPDRNDAFNRNYSQSHVHVSGRELQRLLHEVGADQTQSTITNHAPPTSQCLPIPETRGHETRAMTDWSQREWWPLAIALAWIIDPRLGLHPKIADLSIGDIQTEVVRARGAIVSYLPQEQQPQRFSFKRDFDRAWDRLRAAAADDKVALRGIPAERGGFPTHWIDRGLDPIVNRHAILTPVRG